MGFIGNKEKNNYGLMVEKRSQTMFYWLKEKEYCGLLVEKRRSTVVYCFKREGELRFIG